jgi:predicted nucleic acid-binding protein
MLAVHAASHGLAQATQDNARHSLRVAGLLVHVLGLL